MRKKSSYYDGISAPVNVTWEITSKCNLACRHCLSRDTMANCPGDMSFERCQAFIDELRENKVFQVNLGGGEPFLREDILSILAYCHQNGLVTCVSTNGTLIDDHMARELSLMDLTYVQVSVDGANARTNDAIRGRGSFSKALNAVELFHKYGMEGLSINTVVTRANFQEIGDIYSLGKYYKAKTRLSRFRPSGRAKDVWPEYRLSKSQLAELADYLNDHNDILTGDSFFSLTSGKRRDLGLNMCGAARLTCSVTPSGDVYPCAFLQADDFYAGNLLAQSLKDIWHEAKVFNTLRNLRIDSCESCERFDICHGGCPAVAFFLKNDLNCPDPERLYQINLPSVNDPEGKVAAKERQSGSSSSPPAGRAGNMPGGQGLFG